ncbi:MAG: hypothetical protein EBS69_10165, partial [Verrucomicrobia bacterium]|nr:hypothetical protein [Verrucomicrobiota bacterium]
GFAYFSELISTLPGQIGFSISFSGVPRVADDGTMLADIQTLLSVDLVTQPAANPTGVYSARVDNIKAVTMEKITTAVEAKLEAAAEAAPAAPAAPVAVFNAEEAIAALAAKIEALSKQFADLVTSKLEAAVVEDAPADDAPVAEPAPEAVAAEAKAEVKQLSQPVPSVIAAKVIELEASRGTQPLEVSTETNFSRADLLSQFNAEKDPRRAAEIFKKLQLAR